MTRSITATAQPDNAEANAFLRELPRNTRTVAIDATQEGAQPAQPATVRKLPDAHAGAGLAQPVQYAPITMNDILRAVRRRAG